MQIDHPEIVWHGPSERILSLDFHPFINELITGGSDECISNEASEFDGYAKAWEYEVTPENKIKVTFKFSLKKHSNNVSAVKYSPHARYVATGSDDHSVVVWEMRETYPFMGSKDKKLMWAPRYELRGHSAEISDIKWSPDSKYIISAGFDKRVIVWLAEKSQYVKILDEHKKCIQGLAVDPQFKYILSQGADRMVKIWKNSESKKDDCAFYRHSTLDRLQPAEQSQNKNQSSSQMRKGKQTSNSQNQQIENPYTLTINNEPENMNDGNCDRQNLQEMLRPPSTAEERESQFKHKLFYDEHVPTFYRRPDISPDGELFLFPAGQWRNEEGEYMHCALLYRRRSCARPSFVIPTGQQPSVCARFCPKLFKKSNPEAGMLMQPYYMVFAIGTFNSVLVYNTESFELLYSYGNHHYASITEIAWKDDRILGTSSNDRTCSFMLFEEGELGTPYQITDANLKQLVTRRPYEPQEAKTKIKQLEQDKKTGSLQEVQAQPKPEQTQPHISPIKVAPGGKKRIVPCMIQKFD